MENSRAEMLEDALSKCIYQLIRRDYHSAAVAGAVYNSRREPDYLSQFGPFTDFEEEYCRLYFENVPPQLEGLSPKSLEDVRIHAALDIIFHPMMFESDKPEVPESEMHETNVPGISVENAAKILQKYCSGIDGLRRFRNHPEVTGVRIIGPKSGVCENCQKICKKYSWDEPIPVIPNLSCTHMPPCPVSYLPIMEEQNKKE